MGSQQVTRDLEPTVRLFPVSADSIETRVLPMDLYLDASRGSKPILYRAVGVEFTAEDQRRLVEQGVHFLYVPVHQHAAYRRAMLDRLDRLFRDPNRHRSERVRIVRAACMKAIEDVMLFPKRPEAVDAVADVSRQFAAWSTANNREFSYLLDMSAHDYYTVVHMVDVAVGCGLLIRKLCPGEDALQATVIQGGMLHDIGKRGVPEEILNKAGPLDPEEWQVIKQHPLMGYHELLANATVPPLVLEMVRDHHERPDGKGYANGLADESLGRAARVCAVVDVFDAICAARPYRGPTPPAETLRIMREGSGTQFDREVLQAWIGLVEQMIQEDPERAPSTVEAPPQSTLSHFMAEAPSPASSSDVPYSERLGWEERREHPRFLCNKIVKVGFLRRGKPYPVKPGQWLELRVTDVSRGGVELQTPWPLTLNDVLDIELPLSESWKVRRNARVVRVRKRKDRQWMAGLAFVATG